MSDKRVNQHKRMAMGEKCYADGGFVKAEKKRGFDKFAKARAEKKEKK